MSTTIPPRLPAVPPGRDDHPLAGAGGRLDEEVDRPDRPGLEQGLRQAVDGIAPVVLGHRQFAAGGFGRRNEGRALLHGQRDRLFDHHMDAARERRQAYRRMEVRRRRHDHAIQVTEPFVHRLQRVEHLRAMPQPVSGQVGRARGVCRQHIAHAGQVPWQGVDLPELAEPSDMPASHSPAAHQPE